MSDARFEEGQERPLRLIARDPGDVAVVSAFLQDAVLTPGDISWDRRRRQAAFLLNRFRWEDREAAEARGRPFERVRTVMMVEDVEGLSAQGVDPRDRDAVLSLLSLTFEGDPDAGGELTLILAGDGALRLQVEALQILVRDVTRPYRAPSGRAPRHPE